MNKTIAGAAALAAAAALGVTVLTDGGIEVKPGESIAAAVAKAQTGDTVTVKAGSYPRLVLKGVKRDDPATPELEQVTVKADGVVNIAGIELRQSSGLRFEGVHLTAAFFAAEGSNHLTFAGGDIGPSSQGVELKGSATHGPVTHVTITRSRIHDITDIANGTTGYGVRASVGGVHNLTVDHTLIEQTTGDAIQTSGVRDLRIEDNEIRHIRRRPGSAAHTDSMQIMRPGRNSTFAKINRNYIHDNGHPPLVFCCQKGLEFTLNVVARIDNECLKVSGPPAPNISSNTFAECKVPTVRIGDSDGTNPADDPFPSKASEIVFANNIYPGLSGGASGYKTKAGSILTSTVKFGDGYELLPDSPGIDQANPTYAPEFDRLGRERAGAPDAGALEYQPPSPGPTPTDTVPCTC